MIHVESLLRWTVHVTILAACLVVASARVVDDALAETSLLQVKKQVAHRSAAAPARHNLKLATAACHDALCGGKEYPAYQGDSDLFSVVIEKWDSVTAYCKLENTPSLELLFSQSFKRACLWKGCVAENDLVKGATEYFSENPWNADEAKYCFKEHCKNAEFDLHTTRLPQAQAYCDKKFGPKWRKLTAGPDGKGWPDQQEGSGLWECAHGNYHCDWAHCKLNYCDKPELLEQHKQKQAQQQGQQPPSMGQMAYPGAEMYAGAEAYPVEANSAELYPMSELFPPVEAYFADQTYAAAEAYPGASSVDAYFAAQSNKAADAYPAPDAYKAAYFAGQANPLEWPISYSQQGSAVASVAKDRART